MSAQAENDPVPGLQIVLEQSSTGPPLTITVTVKNTNEKIVSILPYGSPLDASALPLGVLSITPEGANTPLDLPEIQIQRVWPPKRDDLISIEPGESATETIELNPAIVPREKLGKQATVVLKGTWGAVWAKKKNDIDDTELENPRASKDAFMGDFKSEELQISID